MRTVFSNTLRVARQARAPTGKRFASNISEQTEAAQKKAQEALANAQKTAEKVLESAKGYMGPAGEKAASMLGCAFPFSFASVPRHLLFLFLFFYYHSLSSNP